ncbi:MAG: protein phosphatase CheZ [Alphaproteobacteria bacterium]|nr:protein phosphatase CheZ [Alphaproteobacteria bacterium]
MAINVTQTAGRKLFTAEIQRMKRDGQSTGAQRSVGGSVDSVEILEAIAALRGDVKDLQKVLAGTASLDDDTRQRLTHEKVALENEKAEMDILRTEVRALSRCIQQTKAEIAALRPVNSDDDHIIVVTNELDAVVEATEHATNGILEKAEQIENVVHNLQSHLQDNHARNLADQISDHVVGIFEACNFQDITGQRITKVVNTLKFIETRVAAMVEIWGDDSFAQLGPSAAPDQLHTDDHLVSGPALVGKGISQDDIDKMFG